MKKIALACLALSFYFCYLEWPPDNSMFLFQGLYQIITLKKNLAGTLLHPAVLVPLVGQLLVIYAIFQKSPNKRLVLIGIIGMGLFVLLVLLIGVLNRNVKIVLSTLPFLFAAMWCIRLFLTRKPLPAADA